MQALAHPTLAVIPARGGSKSIPKKNLADLGGKPLIAHMIGHALAVPEITDLVVSTDDADIAETARTFGAQVPFMRPAELAGDDVPSWPVVQHAVREMERSRGAAYDFVVLLQCTAPLCRPRDIAACLRRLGADDCESVVTVVREHTRHPFRMKRIVGDDILINFIDQGFEDMRPRQSLPPIYRRSGACYASRRSVVMDGNTIVGRDVRAVVVPEWTAVDIDAPIDLEMVRLLLAHRTSQGSPDE